MIFEVEKSKDDIIEIDIVLNTKDKAPGPAVVETAEEEHKEVSKRTGLVQDWIAIYLKLNKILDFWNYIKLKEKFYLNLN